MCGICGEVRFDGTAPDRSTIEAMKALLAERGPDDDGTYSGARTALGHRRLKIMDLSDGSHQPMVDEELGLALVFNGAIYNHAELRAELKSQGYGFRSSGDTEVVLKAFHAWGRECLQRFKGMFAFAALQLETDELFLARDRLGIKPLYYSLDEQRIRFASTLPALLAGGAVDTAIDPVALNYYLTFHSVVPEDRTILKGVAKLPPGHTLTIDRNGRQQLERYWSLSYRTVAEKSEAEWREETLAQLRAAVQRRLVAAVDVGVLLSGGVDSSLLVGLIAEAGISRFQTYSVGFEAVGDTAGDEFQYSDIIAEHFATQHHKIRVDSSELLSELPNAIKAMSEPMVSHDCIGFYLLSREVAKSCRAVQSGQGADEVFGGYHWYPPMAEACSPLQTYSDAFFDRDFDEYQRTVNERYLQDDFATRFVAGVFEQDNAVDPIDKALHLDTTVMLVEDPVKRVDNMTMAWGLEARVPFLDHELVEFAATMPASLKVSGEGKYILKEAARAVIPAAVIDRPKGYFPVPALKYLRGEVLEFVRHALTSDAARRRGLFRTDYVETLFKAPEDHITKLRGSKLWQLGLLECWLQAQGL